MPVINIPCYYYAIQGEGLAAVLTDSCTAIFFGRVYHLPKWRDYGREGKHITSAEFTALIREPLVRCSVFCEDYEKRGIHIVVKNPFNNFNMAIAPKWDSLDSFEFWSPRIAWLANYERIKRHQRYTAFAMAGHSRLGEGCGLLRVLGDDVIKTILQTAQHDEEGFTVKTLKDSTSQKQYTC